MFGTPSNVVVVQLNHKGFCAIYCTYIFRSIYLDPYQALTGIFCSIL